MKKSQIFVVEDERIAADYIKMSLQRLEYAVYRIAVSEVDTKSPKALASLGWKSVIRIDRPILRDV